MKQLSKHSLIAGILLLCMLFTQSTKAQNVRVSIDERAELVSIVGRLAQFDEYSQGRIQSYNEAIDTYFKDYNTHRIIAMAQEFRKEYGLAYDAMMWVALHIDIEKDSIKINRYADNNLPSRWTKERLELFVNELSDFYQKSNFNTFFNSNQAIYAKAKKGMTDISTHSMAYDWFNEFWGTQASTGFNVIVSLVNGCANYGLKITDENKNEIAHPVIGVCQTDSTHTPLFNAEYLVPMFVHEINHSYDKGVGAIVQATQEAQEIILPYIEDIMKKQAYAGWHTLVEESMVRAGVINYMQNDTINSLDVRKEIKQQHSRGFVWMEQLVKQLEIYQNNRELYPTILHFTPQIVKVFEETAQIMTAPDFSFPKLIDTSIANGSITSADNTEIIFTFNKPMVTKGYGFTPGNLGPNAFPKIEQTEWLNDTQLRITVQLEPQKEYSIRLFPIAYLDKEGFPLLDNPNLSFKTE